MAAGLVHRTARRSHRADPRMPVVVVGSGRSGSHFVQELLLCDDSEQFGITVFDGAGTAPHMDPARCTVFGGICVVRIDRFAQVVLSDDGRVTPYWVLVLALGSGRGLDLAVLSGLPVERGLVVDQTMRVVDEEAIHAIGSCAQHPGQAFHAAMLVRRYATLVDIPRGVFLPGEPKPVKGPSYVPGSNVQEVWKNDVGRLRPAR